MSKYRELLLIILCLGLFAIICFAPYVRISGTVDSFAVIAEQSNRMHQKDAMIDSLKTVIKVKDKDFLTMQKIATELDNQLVKYRSKEEKPIR